MKIDIKLLKKLCLIPSPSRNEQPMISFIINQCYKIPNITFELDHYNNLFITKNTSNPEYYPCVLAHMDMVITHKSSFGINIQNGVISGYHISDRTPCSLGLDDKVGICIALQLLQEIPNLKVVFTTEEEIGAIGAREATTNVDFLSNVRYFLQADRKGCSDFITFTNCLNVVSPEFKKDLTPILQKYGYTGNTGTLTDVGEFCEQLGISGCNLSCGYYNQHSTKEYGIIEQMTNCLNLMEEIIRTLPEDKVYELEVENPYQYYQDDPYGLYRQYSDYDFEWNPDEDAWEKYNSACKKAEEESPKEPEFDEIPCDYCKNFDCMNCKYINGF
jgi:putative aminopeptidase FrvX